MDCQGRIGATVVSLLLAWAAVVEAAETGRSFPGPDRSPEGLELTDFAVRVVGRTPHVGSIAKVEFKLTNVSGHSVVLGEKGVFLSVRWGRKDEEAGRDRGFVKGSATLEPGRVIKFFELVELDQAGAWRFWPAYQHQRGFGPARWHELEIEVEEPVREERRLAYCADVDTLPHGVALLGFTVFGPDPLRVGDEVTIEYHLQNRTPQPLPFGKGGVWVVARNRDKERAFGHQLAGEVLRPNRPDKVLAVEARTRIDSAGEWVFRPAFDVPDRTSPPGWCPAIVTALR